MGTATLTAVPTAATPVRLSDLTELELNSYIYPLDRLGPVCRAVGLPIDNYTLKLATEGRRIVAHKVGRRHLYSIRQVLDFLNSPERAVDA